MVDQGGLSPIDREVRFKQFLFFFHGVGLRAFTSTPDDFLPVGGRGTELRGGAGKPMGESDQSLYFRFGLASICGARKEPPAIVEDANENGEVLYFNSRLRFEVPIEKMRAILLLDADIDVIARELLKMKLRRIHRRIVQPDPPVSSDDCLQGFVLVGEADSGFALMFPLSNL